MTDWDRWEEQEHPYWGMSIVAYQYRDRVTGRVFQAWQSDGGPKNVIEVDAETGERLNAPDETSRVPRDRGVIFSVPYGQSWLETVERYIASQTAIIVRFKDEDEIDGETIGPVAVNGVSDGRWYTRSEALRIAQAHGVSLEEA